MKNHTVYTLLATTDSIDEMMTQQIINHSANSMNRESSQYALLYRQANGQNAKFDLKYLLTHDIANAGATFKYQLESVGVHADTNDDRFFVKGGDARKPNGQSFQWAVIVYFDI
jgi:hypothetical protein